MNNWQQENYKQTNIKKLCLTLKDKKKYVINYRYLKLVLSLGYELEKVHRVLEYEQSDFLKKYIDLNTKARKDGKNDFEKNFYKLMNNSVYGKTMENVKKRINFRLIQSEKEALACKNVKHWNRFGLNLVGVHTQKQKVVLNKPIYLGQNILDDSKLIMASFHYNFMMNKVDNDNIKLRNKIFSKLSSKIKMNLIYPIIQKTMNYMTLKIQKF